jgi:hypothetical protein
MIARQPLKCPFKVNHSGLIDNSQASLIQRIVYLIKEILVRRRQVSLRKQAHQKLLIIPSNSASRENFFDCRF